MYFREYKNIKKIFSPNFNPGIIIKTSKLFYISIFTIIAILLTNLLTHQEKVDSFKQMIAAVEKMISAADEIRKLRIEKNIPIDPFFDPNQTGFIGIEFSPITTTLGNPEAKQTALNPDFAALMVRWISDLDLNRGSDIIIHASASFPALTIMAIIACETLDMHPIILSSVGASSYGANLPGFTYLDIENHLFQKGIIKNRSCLLTPGGNNDTGVSLWEGGKQIILESAKHNNYKLFSPKSLQHAIEAKWEFCQKDIKPQLFINIGGNHSAFGEGNCALGIPTGKILSPLKCSTNSIIGLIHKFSRAGIPVFHFLQIRDLALKNGISFAPLSLPEAGQSDIYYVNSKPVWVILISIIILSSLVFMVRKKNKS